MFAGAISHRRRCAYTGILWSGLVLAGCQDGQFSKEQIGTATGGILGAAGGAFAGDLFGGKVATITGGVAGAGAGAWIGNRIGRYLDEQDRQKLTQATAVTATTGKPQTWQNPQTGTMVSTRVASTETKQESVAVRVLRDRVQEVPPIELIGEPYRVRRGGNVRGGPGTDYAVAGNLAAGETVHVIGQVQDSSWYMVGENGAASGFVATSLLEPLPAEAAADAPASAAPPDAETVTVAAERLCRTVEQTVTTADGPETQKVTACQGPNGWEVI